MRWGEGSRLGFEVFGTSNLELQLRVPPVSPVSFESGIGGGSRSFILRAEYFIACYGDEGEENLPWPWRGGSGLEEFRKLPRSFRPSQSKWPLRWTRLLRESFPERGHAGVF